MCSHMPVQAVAGAEVPLTPTQLDWTVLSCFEAPLPLPAVQITLHDPDATHVAVQVRPCAVFHA